MPTTCASVSSLTPSPHAMSSISTHGPRQARHAGQRSRHPGENRRPVCPAQGARRRPGASAAGPSAGYSHLRDRPRRDRRVSPSTTAAPTGNPKSLARLRTPEMGNTRPSCNERNRPDLKSIYMSGVLQGPVRRLPAFSLLPQRAAFVSVSRIERSFSTSAGSSAARDAVSCRAARSRPFSIRRLAIGLRAESSLRRPPNRRQLRRHRRQLLPATLETGAPGTRRLPGVNRLQPARSCRFRQRLLLFMQMPPVRCGRKLTGLRNRLQHLSANRLASDVTHSEKRCQCCRHSTKN